MCIFFSCWMSPIKTFTFEGRKCSFNQNLVSVYYMPGMMYIIGTGDRPVNQIGISAIIPLTFCCKEDEK